MAASSLGAVQIRKSYPALRNLLQAGSSHIPMSSCRGLATETRSTDEKRVGDISDAFSSLQGQQWKPLEPRFAQVKQKLIAGREDALHASWNRLLDRLQEEIPLIVELGPKIIPEIQFEDLQNPSKEFIAEHKKRGVAVIRNVVPEEEAAQWKEDLKKYVGDNPHTKAFPADNPQVFELYWSPSQLRARLHPNMIATHKFLMNFWHSKDPNARISTNHPTSYADRLRIRQPGDTSFALGPHVDSGSVERWEAEGYGRGHVYDKIFEGKWEEYDPFESSCRLPVVSSLYQGIGACSVFRMYQGWLSMSNTGPGEGTLLVNPLLGMATAYYLLRPFFQSKTPPPSEPGKFTSDFLSKSNWSLPREQDSWVHGANPGCGQELAHLLHPHLNLEQSMVHVPHVNPGDYVAWHCDTIHGVDAVHAGSTEAGVMYIPASPLTENNAEHMLRQRNSFLQGLPAPDFYGGEGEGESRHVGRLSVDDVAEFSGIESMRALGLQAWDSTEADLTPGEREVMDRSNKILGFYD